MELPRRFKDRVISITDSINYAVNNGKNHLPDKISCIMINIKLLELEVNKLKVLNINNKSKNKSMVKKYNINTINDILSCTNKYNLDNFLTDLKSYITMYHAFNNIAKVVGDTDSVIESDGFVWIDDGKNNAKVSLDIKTDKDEQ